MLEIQQSQEQKQVLSQEQRRSLEILQAPLPELRELLQEELLSNPLLELSSPDESRSLHNALGESAPALENPEQGAPPPRRRERVWDTAPGRSPGPDPAELAEAEPDFFEVLREQLRSMRRLDGELRALADYLVDCLDDRGYLLFSPEELARDRGTSLFQVEQALYAVQSLQPAGVGARSLEECLLLQLAESKNFNRNTVRLVKEGLPLLAKNDYPAIAGLLDCSRKTAEETARMVRDLNPIPSQGYRTGRSCGYQIPEGEVTAEDGVLILHLDRCFLPSITISAETESLLREQGTSEALQYLKDRRADARDLIRCLDDRETTLRRLLEKILSCQSAWFLSGAPLVPMTMGELARDTGLNISTVSRALHGKSILFRGHSIPLKSLFQARVTGKSDRSFTRSEVELQLRRLIESEEKTAPLNDDALKSALEALNIVISRRTVAKYREGLGIPTAGKRRIGRA